MDDDTANREAESNMYTVPGIPETMKRDEDRLISVPFYGVPLFPGKQGRRIPFLCLSRTLFFLIIAAVVGVLSVIIHSRLADISVDAERLSYPYPVSPVPTGEQFDVIREKAEDGSVKHQLHMGHFYANGDFVEQDFQQAADWYRRAAEQGYARAQYYWSMVNDFGIGVKIDYKTAFDSYIDAVEVILQRAQSGDGNGILDLARLVVHAQGVSRDVGHVNELIKKAAMYQGIMLLYGAGTKQDYELGKSILDDYILWPNLSGITSRLGMAISFFHERNKDKTEGVLNFLYARNKENDVNSAFYIAKFHSSDKELNKREVARMCGVFGLRSVLTDDPVRGGFRTGSEDREHTEQTKNTAHPEGRLQGNAVARFLTRGEKPQNLS